MVISERPPAHDPLPGIGPDTYARWRASELGKITEELQHSLLLRLIENVADKQILDIGCGDGKLAVELTRRGADVIGIDASQDMLNAARQRAAESDTHVELRLATAQSLPFPADRFDMVIAMTILCFVEDAIPVFAEIARVLKPGGKLVIGELNKWSTWAAVRRLRAWLGSALWRRGRFRTPRELRSLAQSAGLEPGPIIGAIYYPRFTLAARIMKRVDTRLGSMITFGAAFLAMTARKPNPQLVRPALFL